MGILARKMPWYANGLAFECQQCGVCCAGPAEGYVWVMDEEILAIGAYLGIPDAQVRDQYTYAVGPRRSLVERPGGRDCIFLEPGGDGRSRRACRIYAVRPSQCRAWPFWKVNLEDANSWAMAGLRCPGVNRGPLIPFDQIEVRRLATPE